MIVRKGISPEHFPFEQLLETIAPKVMICGIPRYLSPQRIRRMKVIINETQLP